MALFYSDGTKFAQGSAGYDYRPARDIEESFRIHINVDIESNNTLAIVDTAGHMLVCDPDTVELIGFDSDYKLRIDSLLVRGIPLRGEIHRVNVRFVAEEGQSITMEVMAFVPIEESLETWRRELRLPPFLGMHGCLERLRIAVDPFKELFYFGMQSS